MTGYSEEQRRALGQAVVHTLDEWGLSADDIITVLALPKNTRTRHVEKYRQGNTALPDDDAIFKRVEHLAGIADALRTTYPLNQKVGLIWLRSPHRRFRRRSPLQVIVDDGIDGLIKIRSEVDCAWSWQLTGGTDNETPDH
ncbi:MAG: DUF2384 domain-containing protein [Gammaproteobacteria bacterium]|jgi:hypothetical protein|nr:DUF2384 domain-containing protein [Gammaproteobacteria bacterium]